MKLLTVFHADLMIKSDSYQQLIYVKFNELYFDVCSVYLKNILKLIKNTSKLTEIISFFEKRNHDYYISGLNRLNNKFLLLINVGNNYCYRDQLKKL